MDPGKDLLMAANIDRTAISKMDAASIAVVLLWFIPEIFTMLSRGIVITRLSPAVEGDIVFADIPTGAQWLYALGLGGKYLCLLVTTLLLSRALTEMSRGAVFTERNAKRLVVSACAVFAFVIFRLAFEGLANNWVASDLGIDGWWDIVGAGTPLSEFAPALLFAITVSVFATIIRRGAKLEEDVDGLV